MTSSKNQIRTRHLRADEAIDAVLGLRTAIRGVNVWPPTPTAILASNCVRRRMPSKHRDCTHTEASSVIYFIHDVTSRAVKIGHAWDPRNRLSTLQISTPNKLALLGAIAGTRRTEQKDHGLVARRCKPKPGETHERPLCIQGEWFDDRILPFVTELMRSPGDYLGADRKKSAPRQAKSDPSLVECKIVLAFDSGEVFHERFLLRAASPALGMSALGDVTDARLSFLANTVRI